MNSLEQRNASDYLVLARKYRPKTFSSLVGQEVLINVLQNSFLLNKIAHAFMLTGVRGVGKTTTARIIAKGLNCVGLNGSGGSTVEPCNICEQCVAISDSRHVDVLEMDAASRTGVADIREIIESVSYRAASARYKVYIIDEVHMLSTSAFNALLKTLEEPPAHVKFIFATTEIRKVPATIMSRCQRFDLRRIEPSKMIPYLFDVSMSEGYELSKDILGLISRASEGSMRDALSLMEQIIISSKGKPSLDNARQVLGLADRGRVMDLFHLLSGGLIKEALIDFRSIYSEGSDPLTIIKELAEITHWITLIKVSPDLLDSSNVLSDEKCRGEKFSKEISMRTLAKFWQMFSKLLDEISISSDHLAAAEMGLIRVAYVSDLPSPEEIIKKLTTEEQEKKNLALIQMS